MVRAGAAAACRQGGVGPAVKEPRVLNANVSQTCLAFPGGVGGGPSCPVRVEAAAWSPVIGFGDTDRVTSPVVGFVSYTHILFTAPHAVAQ